MECTSQSSFFLLKQTLYQTEFSKHLLLEGESCKPILVSDEKSIKQLSCKWNWDDFCKSYGHCKIPLKLSDTGLGQLQLKEFINLLENFKTEEIISDLSIHREIPYLTDWNPFQEETETAFQMQMLLEDALPSYLEKWFQKEAAPYSWFFIG